jgi:hypothetical protein
LHNRATTGRFTYICIYTSVQSTTRSALNVNVKKTASFQPERKKLDRAVARRDVLSSGKVGRG